MRNGLAVAACLVFPAALASGPAAAQVSVTDTFTVQITIVAECQINSAEDMDFGEVGVIDDPIEATSTIGIQCTNETPFSIGLDAGTGPGATVATRQMTGPDTQTVAYSLYTDAARTDVWGNTIGTDAVDGTGTGIDATFTVYGLVPPQPTPSAGTYTDTVTVTVTY